MSHMRKIGKVLAIAILVLAGFYYAVNHTRLHLLWMLLTENDSFLVVEALAGPEHFDFHYFEPPKRLTRYIVDHKDIDFGSSFMYGERDSLFVVMSIYMEIFERKALQEDLDYALKIAGRAIAGGAKIDSLDKETRAPILHAAIFRKNPTAVRFLIDHGASCYTTTFKMASPFVGLNAYGMADWMEKKFPGSMKEIYPILQDCKDKEAMGK